MVINLFVMYFMMFCFYGSAAYYAQYVIGDVSSYSSIANAMSMAQIITMFCTPFIMKKVSKRNCMIIGLIFSTIGFLGSGIVGANLAGQVGCSVIKGIGDGFGGAAMYGLLQDAITYGQWKNGYGNSGMGNAASSFCMKVGSGVGTAALGWVLAWGKFDAGLKVQTASAITAIDMAFVWIPIVTNIIGIVCLMFFDLDKIYDKIIKELEERKQGE